MSNDKLPALPPRPKSFRAKTFDPYDDVFSYAETKAHMDTQDARIATLVAEAEISDERAAEYRDGNRGLGKRIAELEREIRKLKTERDTPETEDFFKGVPLEAAHQRGRWGNEHDSGKEPQDWFWLVGYLAGKCLASDITGDRDKALHHTISTAAALANWHMAIKGNGNMRPGIETPVEERNVERENGK